MPPLETSNILNIKQLRFTDTSRLLLLGRTGSKNGRNDAGRPQRGTASLILRKKKRTYSGNHAARERRNYRARRSVDRPCRKSQPCKGKLRPDWHLRLHRSQALSSLNNFRRPAAVMFRASPRIEELMPDAFASGWTSEPPKGPLTSFIFLRQDGLRTRSSGCRSRAC